MSWHEGLLDEQRRAAEQFGNHARLLAGPGTGKTFALTRRVRCLVEERGVEPRKILALTFTRAAAHELRQRVHGELGVQIPRISTLHSFALRQLLRNAKVVNPFPDPLRIADDWEERYVVEEDLKALLGLSKVTEARELLNHMSADWQTLTADEDEWEKRFPSPRFLSAWREHRRIYGYALRSELVYQLKHAVEEHENFQLEGPPIYLLVDEYQDLNRCDLALVDAIRDRGAEVFVAGDDDQSIYGFRMAHPDGIRRFADEYGADSLALTICMRCASRILKIASFVAQQDHERDEKELVPLAENGEGEVEILRFSNEDEEANGIARLCAHLVRDKSVLPEEILVLVRFDRYGRYSSVLRAALERAGIPVAQPKTGADPLMTDDGRGVVSILRLWLDPRDHLAWRTLLQISKGVGPKTIQKLYERAKSDGSTFSDAVLAVADDPSLISSGRKVKGVVDWARSIIDSVPRTQGGDATSEGDADELLEGLREAWKAEAANAESTDDLDELLGTVVEKTARAELHDQILGALNTIAENADAKSVNDLVQAMGVSDPRFEQEREKGKANILTMHKAKGLTADATIVMAAEDELLPGREEGEREGDERRLLYVSLSRARQFLFVTYCEERVGVQRQTGRNAGNPRRTLTRFLRDAPLAPKGGRAFVAGLG